MRVPVASVGGGKGLAEGEFADPTEAAEVVLFADLLMRQLEHVEKRLATA